MLRHVVAEDLVRDADQVAEQPSNLSRQPHQRLPGPVGERHHGDPVVGSEEDLGVEPRKYPLMLEGEMPAEVYPKESEPDTRDPGIRLIVGSNIMARVSGLSIELYSLAPPPRRAAR